MKVKIHEEVVCTLFMHRLKCLRTKKGLTQADVAKAVGVSTATIGNYEQGTRTPRNNEIWTAIAELFNVSVDFLMGIDTVNNENIVSFYTCGGTNNVNVTYVVDENTGVNYIVVHNYNGNIAITPRFNKDGSLYTSE